MSIQPDAEKRRRLSRKIWPRHRIVRTLVKTAMKAENGGSLFDYRAGGELEAQDLEQFADLLTRDK